MDAATWTGVIGLASQAVTLIVGCLVLFAAPRQRANQGYLLWAAGGATLGGTVALILLFLGDLPEGNFWTDAIGPVGWLRVGANAATIAGLILLAASFPTPLSRHDRALTLAALVYAVLLVALDATWGSLGFVPDGPPPGFLGYNLHLAITRAATWSALLLLALRASRAADPKPHAILSLAIMLPVAVGGTSFLDPSIDAAGLGGAAYRAVGPLTVGLLTVSWMRVLLQHGSRWAIAVLWSLLLAVLLGVMTIGASQTSVTVYFWTNLRNLGRLAGALLLAYLVVRGQVPGLEGRLRWGASRGTVAAAFVAAFFVGTEAAQQFFGESLGSTYVGIAVAGALVFLFAPLQRLADRLVAPAFPEPPVARAAGNTAEAYRAAVRAAMRDGVVERREELHLAQVAEHLGLGAHDAARLRHEVEDAEAHARAEA